MSNTEIPRVCFFCKHWHPEDEALDEEHRAKALLVEGKIGDLQTGKYGKCRATFIDRGGNKHFYDKGTLGASPCTAKDDKGNQLYVSI